MVVDSYALFRNFDKPSEQLQRTIGTAPIPTDLYAPNALHASGPEQAPHFVRICTSPGAGNTLPRSYPQLSIRPPTSGWGPFSFGVAIYG